MRYTHRVTVSGAPVALTDRERRFTTDEMVRALGQATEMHRELVRVVHDGREGPGISAASPSAPPTSSTASAEAPAMLGEPWHLTLHVLEDGHERTRMIYHGGGT